MSADLPLKISPGASLNYADVLARGTCLFCGEKLEWRTVSRSGGDDRVCEAVCCGQQFSLVPEQVRVILRPVQSEFDRPKHHDEDFIDDFLLNDDYLNLDSQLLEQRPSKPKTVLLRENESFKNK